MADIEFQDFSIEVKNALEAAAIAFLEEAGGEVVAQTSRNLSKEKGRWHTEQREQWRHVVDEANLEVTIGNPMERSLWTEYGTGEFAEKGDGRKGWWVYVKDDNASAGSGSSYAYEKSNKSYTFAEAKRIMAMMRADGLDAHMTRGQQAKRPFRNAFNKVAPMLLKLAKEKFGDLK